MKKFFQIILSILFLICVLIEPSIANDYNKTEGSKKEKLIDLGIFCFAFILTFYLLFNTDRILNFNSVYMYFSVSLILAITITTITGFVIYRYTENSINKKFILKYFILSLLIIILFADIINSSISFKPCAMKYKIVDKKTNEVNRNLNHLCLISKNSIKNIYVHKDNFNNYKIGDSISVSTRQGILGLRYVVAIMKTP